MSDRLWVATRKGLFLLERSGKQSSKWDISHKSFLGEPVTMMLSDWRDGSIYAALRLGHFGPKLHRSADGGKSWKECAVPSFPAVEGNGEKPSVDMVWALEAGGPEGEIWAGALPAGLFRSRDNGESWELIRSLWDRPERKEWFGGGYDHPGIHSICVDPRNSEHITIAISCGGVWHTNDGCKNWELRGKGMRGAYLPPEIADNPNLQDPHRMIACPSDPEALWVQHHCGIFRSTDRAGNWKEITEVKPSGFGFAVAVHPKDADTAWFVPAQKDECRIPVDGKVVVNRTRDGGGSFETLRRGLPQENSYDLVYRHALDIDSEGECLAMGSTTGNLWVSEDQGDSWHNISTHLPPIYAVRFD